MKRFMLFLIIGFTLPLTGCKPCECEKKEAVKPISWYQKNEKERNAKNLECRDNPGKFMSDGNCINASKAESLIESQKTGLIDFKAP